jgi:hypothetical protein
MCESQQCADLQPQSLTTMQPGSHQVARSEAGHLAAAVPVKHRKHSRVRVVPQAAPRHMRILLHGGDTSMSELR